MRNFQKEVEILKSTSQAHQVDELSAPSLYKRRRFRSPAVPEDEEAFDYVDGFASDYGDDTDSAKVRTPRKRNQPRFRFIGSRHSDQKTPDEIKTWLVTTANESMVLTGQFSNVISKQDDMGPFKKAHVQIVIN